MKLKKISFAILVASGLLALASCGGDKSKDSSNDNNTTQSSENQGGDENQGGGEGLGGEGTKETFTITTDTSWNGTIVKVYTSNKNNKKYYGVNVGTTVANYVYFGVEHTAPTVSTEGKLVVTFYSFDDNTFTDTNHCQEIIPALTYGEYYDFDDTVSVNNYKLDLNSLDREFSFSEVIASELSEKLGVNPGSAEAIGYHIVLDYFPITYTVSETDVTYPIEIYNAITDEDLYTDRISRGATVTLADVKAIVEATDYYKESQPDLLYYVKDVLITDDDYEFDTTAGVYIQVDEDDSEPVNVTLNFNGLSVDSITKSTKGKYTIEDFRSKVTNKVILGWSEDPDADFPDYVIDDVFEYDADTVLYCIYRDLFAISYDLNGGTGSMVDGISDNMGDAVIANIPSTSTNGSLVFAGWSQDEDSTEVEYRPGDKINLDDDFFLYAVWVEAYKVSYDLNGAEGEINYSVSDEDGNAELAYLPDEITYDHHHFLGWATYATATEPEFEEGDFVEIDKDVTVYAVWKEDNYVLVTHIYASDVTSEYKFYGDENGLAELALYSYPTMAGYRCLGYADSKTATEAQYERWDKVDVSEGNVELFSIYVKTYTIKFYNGIDYTKSYMTTYDEGQVINLDNKFEKTNYTFGHWIDKDGNVYTNTDDFTVEGELSLYAVWVGNEVTIQYLDIMNGDEVLDTVTAHYGDSIYVLDSDFDFDPLLLVGWTTTPYDYEYEMAELEFYFDTPYLVDDFASGDVVSLYPCFEDMYYTFTDYTINPTLESDGLIIHECDQDDELTTSEKISNKDVFAMYVNDSFSIQGKGTVLTGIVTHGTVTTGQTLSLYKANGEIVDVIVEGIEMFNKVVDSATVGDNIGILFGNQIAKTDVTKNVSILTSKDQIILSNQFFMDAYINPTSVSGLTSPLNVRSDKTGTSAQFRICFPGFANSTRYPHLQTAAGYFVDAYSYTTYEKLSNVQLDSKALIKIQFAQNVVFPLYIGQELSIVSSAKVIGSGTIIARTDEQISDILANQKHITICDTITNTSKTLFLDKNMKMSDLDLPFTRNGYTFYGYSSEPNVAYNELTNDERNSILSATVNDLANQTLYIVWEPVNKTNNDLYITKFSYVDKHANYTSLGSDSAIKSDISVGQTILIKLQNGDEFSTTVTRIYVNNESVTTAAAGTLNVQLEITGNFTKGMQYGDVVVFISETE